MSEFPIKKGDRLPRLKMALTDSSGTALDLTGASVTFRMRARQGGALKVNAAGSISGTPTAGLVEYAWAPGDTDTEGLYDAEWVLSYSGVPQTVPTSGFVTVVVGPALA